MGAIFPYCFFCGCNACTVHQTHQFAHGDSLGHHSLAIGLVAHIAFHKGAAQFFGDGFAFFGLHVGNDHFAAVGR